MKVFTSVAATTGALLLAAGAASATVTTTPYNPTAPTDLSMFVNGNELAAQTVTFKQDASGLGVDVIVQVDPAGAGQDKADQSLADQFTNLYFGNNTTGTNIGFELGNHDAFVPSTGAKASYGAAVGITYTDIQGTSYATGGVGSESIAFIPYSVFTTNVLGLPGFTPYNPGDTLMLRDVQAFSYAGNNAGGGARFGSVIIPTAVSGAPEPSTWALLFSGVGALGGMFRRRRRDGGALAAAA